MVHGQTGAFGIPRRRTRQSESPILAVANIGYHGKNPESLEVPLEFFGIGMADKQSYGGLCPGGSERMHRIFRLIQTGKIDLTPMTTHEFGFEEI